MGLALERVPLTVPTGRWLWGAMSAEVRSNGWSVVRRDELLALLTDIACRYELADLALRARVTAEQSTRATLTVAVVGQFKAGKSSLLNALVGTDVLPVRAVPATSVITVVTHGPSVGAVVRYLSGETRTIAVDELDRYVTEQHNPRNCLAVERVTVTTRALGDFPDLELVDTPGLGSTSSSATETSTDWLPNVGAAIVAVSATQPLAAADLELIESLHRFTPEVAIVLTKMDLLSEADRAAVRAFVGDQARSHVGRDVQVIAFSAAAGADALREELVGHLRSLQAHHGEAVDELTEHRTAQLVGECRAYLSLAAAATDAESRAVEQLAAALEGERRGLRRVAQEARAVVSPIRSELEAAAVDRLSAEVPRLSVAVRDRLADQLPRWHGSLVEETEALTAWLSATLSAELAPVAREAADACRPFVDRARAPLDRLGQALVQRLTDDVRQALGISFEPPSITAEALDAQPVQVAISPVFDNHLEMLSWAVPMMVFRPLVHRHFTRFVGWQVEKNSLRLGYETAAAAGLAIGEMVNTCLAAMAERIEACERMVRQSPRDGPAPGALLDDLDRLTALRDVPMGSPAP